MQIEIRQAVLGQEHELAELRARAMRTSLEAINRYDEKRVRERLLNDYNKDNIRTIYLNEKLIGFWDFTFDVDVLRLRHLYIEPEYQNYGIGSIVLEKIINERNNIPIKLKALRNSRANQFYKSHGFTIEAEEEFDTLHIYNGNLK